MVEWSGLNSMLHDNYMFCRFLCGYNLCKGSVLCIVDTFV